MSEVGGQMSEVGGRERTEVGGQRSEGKAIRRLRRLTQIKKAKVRGLRDVGITNMLDAGMIKTEIRGLD